MKIESIDGIILTETNYSETSKILNVLTKEHGLIGVISKGCRNMKSKLRSVSRKLLYGTIHIYYKPSGLSTLISIDVKNSYSNILMDLEKISYASYILDLTNQLVKQSENEEIFELLKNTLEKIEEGLNPIALTNILELKYLDFLGVSPSIDGCAHCGNNKQIITLSSDAGGYICKDCYNNEPLVSDKTIKMIRMYYYVDIKNITKLDVSPEITDEITRFLDDYYDRFTGLYLKSKKTIKKINQITN
ncbi:MAG: DNA repair protein RecO [Bacilli bacterium]|nr:DNA repair protein RecO [Bacilli bacterium]